MPRYCKAFRVGQLRSYPGWPERPPAGDKEAWDDQRIVYLDEALRVFRSPFDEASPLYEDGSDAWRRFCAGLGFAVPDWDAESKAVRAALTGASST